MRTALLSIAFLTASAVSAQFTSGFETWNDTLPTDWYGAKSSIISDSVTQVTTNVHGGNFAVRLQNGSTSHKRFTTQPLPVANGTIYTISFWVRGNGSIRTGLFDNRAGGSSGYAPYNAYYVSSGDTWTEVTQQIAAANDWPTSEFILSVLQTSGPEHIVVDDVTIMGGGSATEATIYEIQYTTDASGNSPLAGQIVTAGGIVTAVDTIGADSYFIQNGQGPWTGIWVNDPSNAVSLGDSVLVTAAVEEYFLMTRLNTITSFDLVSSGNTVPAPEVITPNQAQEEQWESMLVKIMDIGCVSAPNQFNEWPATSTTSGVIVVNDLCYAYTPVIGNYYTITGVLDYSFSERKLEPRFLADIEVGSGVASLTRANLAVRPNPVSDVLWIDAAFVGRAAYTLLDASGRIVLSGALTNGQLPVAGLLPGTYTLILRDADSIRQSRVVVQR